MILLKTLRWSNLFSYSADNEIALSEEPIVQLIGFNGHGKSSIPLILEETLFNKNSKGIKKADIPNRILDTTKYSSLCTFSIDSKEYSIAISRSGATQKVKLLENGIDISSHTATATFAQIENLLGIDFKTFSQLVYQNSSSSLQFLTATDSNRKKFLIDLLSLDRYIAIFERVKLLYKEVSDSLIKVQSKESTIRAWLEQASSYDLTELSLKALPTLDSSKPTILWGLKAQLQEISSINSKINTNNHYKSRLSDIDSTALVTTKSPIDPKPLDSRKTEIQHELKKHRQLHQKYAGLTYSQCPTCYQDIDKDRISKITREVSHSISTLSEEEKVVIAQLKTIEDNNREVSVHQALVKEFESYSILIDSSMPTLLLDKQEIEESIKQLEDYIKSINSRIDIVSKENNSIAAHNAKVLAIKEQLTAYTTQLAEVSTELVKITKKLSILEVLKKAFSTTGLIAYKIENSVKELEELTNSYLSELSDGRFELLFELSNDKLNVVIVDNGKNIEITALSAGELARVTTSTLLAIRKLMAYLSKSRINVLFLDETLDVLDLEGKERLIEVLLKEEGLNTFIISHSYSHPLVKKLEIVKESGISRINNG